MLRMSPRLSPRIPSKLSAFDVKMSFVAFGILNPEQAVSGTNHAIKHRESEARRPERVRSCKRVGFSAVGALFHFRNTPAHICSPGKSNKQKTPGDPMLVQSQGQLRDVDGRFDIRIEGPNLVFRGE